MEEEPPPAKKGKAPPVREDETRSVSEEEAPPDSRKNAFITESGHVPYLLERARRVLKMRPHSRKRELARLQRVLIDVARVKLNTTLRSAPDQTEQAIDGALDYVRDPVAALAGDLPGLPYAILSELKSLARVAATKKPRSTPSESEVRAESSKRPTTKKPGRRRNPKNQAIDAALLKVEDARPKSHEELCQMLDREGAPIPDAEPFKSARGWLKGYHKHPANARSFLSPRRARLGLRPFVPGPKKKL